jgi:hypothetical protein
MKKNKTETYLKYAIGEIILIVVGILFALSINNCNENRKLHNEELSLLLEVKSNLEVTLNSFKKDTLINLNSILQFRKIEHYIDKDLPYNTELNTAFGGIGDWQSPYPITAAYVSLKTRGLDIISNSVLKNEIINLYEYKLVVLTNDYDKGEWSNLQSFNSFLYKHISSRNSKQAATPNDFESLKTNKQFSNILGKIISQREAGLDHYEKAMISIEKLIKHLDKELISKK